MKCMLNNYYSRFVGNQFDFCENYSSIQLTNGKYEAFIYMKTLSYTSDSGQTVNI